MIIQPEGHTYLLWFVDWRVLDRNLSLYQVSSLSQSQTKLVMGDGRERERLRDGKDDDAGGPQQGKERWAYDPWSPAIPQEQTASAHNIL